MVGTAATNGVTVAAAAELTAVEVTLKVTAAVAVAILDEIVGATIELLCLLPITFAEER